ncbi:MAG: HAD family phosphatase [Ignavibacteriae bacterium]|nr:HAD family phosphatase [Ignavibacteriota bacterium]
MPLHIQAVIFDLDGLMLDTERIAANAWVRVGEEFGIPISETIVLDMIGRTGPDSDGILMREFGPDFPLQTIKQRRVELTDNHFTAIGIPVKAGLLPLLDYLDGRSIRKAVATSSTRERAWMKLSRGGLADRFPVVVSSDDIARGKPQPDIYLHTSHLLNVPPENCLVFEDSDAGVRAAASAGMHVIIIPDLKQPSPDVVPLALRVESSLTQALEYLAELTG